MFVFVGCRGLLVLSIAVACCLAAEGLAEDESYSSSSSSAYTGVSNDLPCIGPGDRSYRMYLHGAFMRLNDCKVCTCDNSTLSCQIESCPQELPCGPSSRTKLDGECCKTCPKNVVPRELSCMYDDQIIRHGERKVALNDCSYCDCDNSTLSCQYLTCPPLGCRQRIRIEGECCKICGYNVSVNEINPEVPQASIKQGKANEIALQLKVKYSEAIPWNKHDRGVWTVRVWMSSSENGQNELSGTVMQKALHERERPSSEMEGKVVFNDVSYGFDLTGHTCQDAKFICAQFINPKKERNVYYSLVFISPLYGELLTSCVENTNCRG
ncbi:chordin-like protein 1 [Asterias amurensis]|uniref:chordin-like protein 1 n=1 Tax=Asterias amurensis TaxID=7602 RepID=UPI003AB4E7A4